MHIEKFEAGWLTNPFWRGSFLLRSQEDLDTALASGIRHVWIDTAKGARVQDEAGESAAAAEEAPEEGAGEEPEDRQAGFGAPEEEPAATQEAQSPPPEGSESSEDEIGPRFDTPSPFADEMERAGKIVRQANLVVKRMFADAKEGRVVDLEQARPVVQAISSSVKRHPDALVAVARHKERGEYATMHSVASCALMTSLAAKMGKSDEQRELAGMAELLMDLGLATVPQSILGKAGPFTVHEMERVKEHASEGVQLLRKSKDVPKDVFHACLCHHERFDASGYPKGLAGEAIPEVARMAALCDVYDAMTSDRPHRAGMSPSEALKEIARQKEKFDPKLLQAFVKTLGIYPVGSLVRLESAQLAVVIEQGKGSLLHPVVKVSYKLEGKERFTPVRLELGPVGDKVVSKEDPAQHGFGSLDAFWRFD